MREHAAAQGLPTAMPLPGEQVPPAQQPGSYHAKPGSVQARQPDQQLSPQPQGQRAVEAGQQQRAMGAAAMGPNLAQPAPARRALLGPLCLIRGQMEGGLAAVERLLLGEQ